MRSRRSRATSYGSVQQKTKREHEPPHSTDVVSSDRCEEACVARIAYIQRRSLLVHCIIVALMQHSHSRCESRLGDSTCCTAQGM